MIGLVLLLLALAVGGRTASLHSRQLIAGAPGSAAKVTDRRVDAAAAPCASRPSRTRRGRTSRAPRSPPSTSISPPPSHLGARRARRQGPGGGDPRSDRDAPAPDAAGREAQAYDPPSLRPRRRSRGRKRWPGPAFRELQTTIAQVLPGVLVAPNLLVGATDSRHYRKLTNDIYRFLPMRLGPGDLNRLHGTNERIGVASYAEAIRFYAQLIRRAAG